MKNEETNLKQAKQVRPIIAYVPIASNVAIDESNKPQSRRAGLRALLRALPR